jgi:hypothetical protein
MGGMGRTRTVTYLSRHLHSLFFFLLNTYVYHSSQLLMALTNYFLIEHYLAPIANSRVKVKGRKKRKEGFSQH